MNSPIFITGAPRSGTSLTAGAFRLCGGWIGDVGPLSGGAANPTGMQENVVLRNEVLMPLLGSLTGDPAAEHAFPDSTALPGGVDVHAFCTAVTDRLVAQGWDGGLFVWKDPKLCLLWPLLRTAFPGARWILVWRDAQEVADSLARAPFAREYGSDAQRWRATAEAFTERLLEIQAAGLPSVEVWPHRIIAGDVGELRRAVEWAGLAWDEARVRSLIRPDAWHGGVEA